MALRTLPRNTTVAATISTDIDDHDEPYMAVFIEVVQQPSGSGFGGSTAEYRKAIQHIDEGVAIVRRWCFDRSIPVPPIYYIGECDPRVTFWIHTHASEPNTLQERQGLVG